MKKKARSDSPDALLEKLAVSSPNDAVKLLFLDEEDLSLLDELDLSLLTEMKRNANGTVEIKLLDKLEVIRQLNELKKCDGVGLNASSSFYTALDRAAGKLSDKAADDEV